ncbi:hypothetical protein ACFGVR_10415 [Mucilaginibacter sp. AW1-3]
MKYLTIRCIPLLAFALLLILSSCQSKGTVETFTPVTDAEIYDVVNALVKQERLDTINFNKQWPLRVIDTLGKVKVYFTKPGKKNEIVLPPPRGDVSYTQLISMPDFFMSRDSSFLVYQNQNNGSIVLKKSKFNQIKIITRKEYDREIEKDRIYSLLTLSVPIFSHDHMKAYMQMGFHCGGLCGYGKDYYLIKIKSKWVVKYKRNTWIS